MPNQALAFHRVSKHVYDLTGLRTGSVRDQLLRSSLVTHCLVDEGLISRSQKLLIFGAGAAGLNAAITAADLGVSVDVIEIDKDPFGSFRLASWRRIDPVEYDWPHDHFDAGVFPPGGTGIPLVQHTGTGDDLASLWAADWKAWDQSRNGRGHRGKVELLVSTDARLFKPGIKEIAANGHVEVTGPWPSSAGGANTTRTYGAVISCVGFGPERTFDVHSPARWNGYSGPSFWLDEDFISPGNVTPLGVDKVVISGGGDGGMQDFQRVVTGEFGKELLHKLNIVASGLSPSIDMTSDAMLRAFLTAEDAGRRAYAWQRASQPISLAMQTWHDAFASEVSKLFAHLNLVAITQLRQLAADILRPEILSGQLSVTWLYKDATPGYAYALNRYLSLVIQELALIDANQFGVRAVQVLDSHEIVAISPTYSTHSCSTSAGCFGIPHDVVLQSSTTKAKKPINDVGLIVVRHGAMPDPLLAGAAIREQMTPFDLPQ